MHLAQWFNLLSEWPKCSWNFFIVHNVSYKYQTKSRTRTGPLGVIRPLHDNASIHKTKQLAAFIGKIAMQTLKSFPQTE